jgi:hypothetical protein
MLVIHALVFLKALSCGFASSAWTCRSLVVSKAGLPRSRDGLRGAFHNKQIAWVGDI